MGLEPGPWLSELKNAVRRREPEDTPLTADTADGKRLTFRCGELAGEIIGGARVVDMQPGGPAEFAVTLRDEVQGRGLARQALETVVEVAREAGCTSVWGTISAQNTAMLSLARRVGFAIRRDPDDFALMLAEMSFDAD